MNFLSPFDTLDETWNNSMKKVKVALVSETQVVSISVSFEVGRSRVQLCSLPWSMLMPPTKWPPIEMRLKAFNDKIWMPIKYNYQILDQVNADAHKMATIWIAIKSANT